jgi:hypothetical protein
MLATSLTAFGIVAIGTAPAAAALPANCAGTATITCFWAYNGTNGGDGSAQTWIVPAGVTSATFDVNGAEGGGNSVVGTGGRGGNTNGTVSLTPGTTVTILVGGAGHFSIAGFNGGGGSALSYGGGGASDVRIGGTTLADRVLVAGGGGGSATVCFGPGPCTVGGAGGGATGGNGTVSPPTAAANGGEGGTQTAGGAGGGGATNGTAGVGGDGGGTGGGGGGGYFGGGGGGQSINPSSGATVAATGGGGGSGFFDPGVVTGGTTTSDIRLGNGQVSLTYAATPPRQPALEIGNRSGLEGNSGTRTLSFPVTLNRASSVPMTVRWATVNGTARAPGDFAAASGTLTIPAGQTRRNVSVTIKSDRITEPNETFTVRLSLPTNARIDDGTAVGTIVNDD